MRKGLIVFAVLTVLTGIYLLDRLFQQDLIPSPPEDKTIADAMTQAQSQTVRNRAQPTPAAKQWLTSTGAAPEPPPLENPTTPMHKELAPPSGDPIPGEVILGFYNENELQAFLKLARQNGVEVLGTLRIENTVRIRIHSARQLEEILAKSPTPTRRSHNFYVYEPPPVSGSDPRAPSGTYYGFGGAVASWLGAARDHSNWGNNITVAVLDSGVHLHPALNAARVTTLDMTQADTTETQTSHGTSVASLIAGNGNGVQGVAPASNILSIDVMSGAGVGDVFTLAAGIVEAVDKGSKVINISLGSYGESPLLAAAVDYAVEQGAVLVAAAGNEGINTVMYPAAYENVIAVGAVDSAGQHLYFSNRGEAIDITAPGLAINAAGDQNQVIGFSGTSAAVPLVSAALAGLLSSNPNLTASEAAAILLAHTDDYGAPGEDEEYGNGIMNLARMQNRDIPGIYDAAVGRPYITSDNHTQDLVIYVQNRGTEPLPHVDVEMSLGGVPASVAFYNVGVGETASRIYPLDANSLEHYGEITVSLATSIPNTSDALPENDRVSGVVSIGTTE